MPIFAPETSVTARMDLVYHWMMWLLSMRTDMAPYSNKELHLVLDIPASVRAWMQLIKTTQAVTVSYIGPTTFIILVWLNVIAYRKYLYLQERLPSIAEGIVQCVNWQLHQNYGHIKNLLNHNVVFNQCTIVIVKPNSSSICVESKGLLHDHQCYLPLLMPAEVVPGRAISWRRSNRSCDTTTILNLTLLR